MDAQLESCETPPGDPQAPGKIRKAFKLFGKGKPASSVASIFARRGKGEGAPKSPLPRSKTLDGLSESTTTAMQDAPEAATLSEPAAASTQPEGGSEDGAAHNEHPSVDDPKVDYSPTRPSISSITSAKSLNFLSLLRRSRRGGGAGAGVGGAGGDRQAHTEAHRGGRQRKGLRSLFGSMRWRRRDDEEADDVDEGAGPPLTASRSNSVEIIKEHLTLTPRPAPRAEGERDLDDSTVQSQALGSLPNATSSKPGTPKPAVEEKTTTAANGGVTQLNPNASVGEPTSDRLSTLLGDISSILSFDSLTGCGDIVADVEAEWAKASSRVGASTAKERSNDDTDSGEKSLSASSATPSGKLSPAVAPTTPTPVAAAKPFAAPPPTITPVPKPVATPPPPVVPPSSPPVAKCASPSPAYPPPSPASPARLPSADTTSITAPLPPSPALSHSPVPASPPVRHEHSSIPVPIHAPVLAPTPSPSPPTTAQSTPKPSAVAAAAAAAPKPTPPVPAPVPKVSGIIKPPPAPGKRPAKIVTTFGLSCDKTRTSPPTRQSSTEAKPPTPTAKSAPTSTFSDFPTTAAPVAVAAEPAWTTKGPPPMPAAYKPPPSYNAAPFSKPSSFPEPSAAATAASTRIPLATSPVSPLPPVGSRPSSTSAPPEEEARVDGGEDLASRDGLVSPRDTGLQRGSSQPQPGAQEQQPRGGEKRSPVVKPTSLSKIPVSGGGRAPAAVAAARGAQQAPSREPHSNGEATATAGMASCGPSTPIGSEEDMLNPLSRDTGSRDTLSGYGDQSPTTSLPTSPHEFDEDRATTPSPPGASAARRPSKTGSLSGIPLSRDSKIPIKRDTHAAPAYHSMQAKGDAPRSKIPLSKVPVRRGGHTAVKK